MQEAVIGSREGHPGLQLARVADELAGMISRQQGVIDETVRLDELHSSSGKWGRAQLMSLRDLTTAERTLVEETGRLIEKLSAAEVFALALRGAARHMQRAIDLLAQRDTGRQTQKAETDARKRLADLVEALKPDEPARHDDERQDDLQLGGSGKQQGSPPGDGIPTLAQVKMLITLQKELFVRTAEIEKRRGKDGLLRQAARDELDAVAREQGELADLARNLSAVSSVPDNEDDADGTPNEEEKTKPE